MFCPKCGTQNPDTGKFCRACGTDLGNVSAALTGKLVTSINNSERFSLRDKKGKPISYESAITKMFVGLAFLTVSIFLGITNMSGGKFWWFWLLIPAFATLGGGIAQYIQLKKTEQQRDSLSGSVSTGFQSVTPELASNEIQNLLRAGKKIEAIKIHREVFGTSLKDAKEAVERIEREPQQPLYYNSPPPQGSIYDTGELPPPAPSVTENTTRHLEIDKDGETMTLPKK